MDVGFTHKKVHLYEQIRWQRNSKLRAMGSTKQKICEIEGAELFESSQYLIVIRSVTNLEEFSLLGKTTFVI